jgi:Acetyltransferase (GNAT) domain
MRTCRQPTLRACARIGKFPRTPVPRARVHKGKGKTGAYDRTPAQAGNNGVAGDAGPGYALPAFAPPRREYGMRVFLETERILLRRFAESDVENLFALDDDPEVMRFLTGGKPTPRDVILNETLPRFLRAYERFEGFGVWPAIERSTGEFLGGSSFTRRMDIVPRKRSLATGCAGPPGERATPRKDHAR